jgi:excisionase family DNA binding protein
MSEELLSASEVAKLLRVSNGTIARWIKLGQLRAIRLPSGTYRIPRSEVDKLMKQLDQEN